MWVLRSQRQLIIHCVRTQLLRPTQPDTNSLTNHERHHAVARLDGAVLLRVLRLQGALREVLGPHEQEGKHQVRQRVVPTQQRPAILAKPQPLGQPALRGR